MKALFFLFLAFSLFATGCKPKAVSNPTADEPTKPVAVDKPADGQPVEDMPSYPPADAEPVAASEGCVAINRGTAKFKDFLPSIEADVKGDCLHLAYDYSGGCKEHVIELFWDGNWAETVPPVAKLHISHDAKGDDCKMMVSGEKSFDLKTLRYQGLNEVKLDVFSSGAKISQVSYSYK